MISRSLPPVVTPVIMFLIIYQKGDYPRGPKLLTALEKQSFLKLQAEGKSEIPRVRGSQWALLV